MAIVIDPEQVFSRKPNWNRNSDFFISESEPDFFGQETESDSEGPYFSERNRNSKVFENIIVLVAMHIFNK